MYHSEVRCIYNKLNPFYIYVSQWSTLHLQQTFSKEQNNFSFKTPSSNAAVIGTYYYYLGWSLRNSLKIIIP